MKFLFDDESFSFEALRTAGFALYGGADLGEVLATARDIGEGDEASWHRAWKATAQRLQATGENARAAGHPVSAREALLRASNYYRTAADFLLDEPAVSTQLRWGLRNGMWVFGASSFADLIRKAGDYTLDGVAHQITAPTLIMDPENDRFLKGQPQLVHKALTSADAALVTLTGADGAGEHTHAGALGQAHPVMFDWLDTTLTR
jgi:hypothetical protein